MEFVPSYHYRKIPGKPARIREAPRSAPRGPGRALNDLLEHLILDDLLIAPAKDT